MPYDTSKLKVRDLMANSSSDCQLQLSKQFRKACLYEMTVSSERNCKPSIPHYNEAYTVSDLPLLVVPTRV